MERYTCEKKRKNKVTYLQQYDTCEKKRKNKITYLLDIDIMDMTAEEYRDYLDDIEFQRRLDFQAVQDTLTTDDYIDYPELVRYPRRSTGGPVRRTQTQSIEISRRLRERDEYYEEQRRITENNRNTRMLQEVEEYGLMMNRRFRAERNRNVALLRLQLKKELNK